MTDTEYETTNLLAVYGTLRVGQGNWRWALASTSDHLGTDCIDGHCLYSGGIPFMVRSPDDSVVVDIFEVNSDDVWDSLDALEGHPDWYRREVFTTRDGKEVWCYHLPDASPEEMERRGYTKVPHGDWLHPGNDDD